MRRTIQRKNSDKVPFSSKSSFVLSDKFISFLSELFRMGLMSDRVKVTFFETIHQGPQDTIIFNIQNEKVGNNGEIFFNVIPMETHSEKVKTPNF